MTIENALSRIDELLKKAEIKGSGREFVMILSDVLGKSIEYIYAHSEDEISDEMFLKTLEIAEKRANGAPIAYILGKKEFFGLNFNVSTNVLIPRPETEMMVDAAVNWVKSFKKDEKLLILDIGTGSGCIPIAIAKNVDKKVDFIATDFSEDTLRVAIENVKSHGLEEKIELKKSNLLKDVNVSIFDQKNVLITANLPYLSTEIYDNSPSSVQDFEPKEALISGSDGLDHYRQLFNQITENNISIMAKSVLVLLEISPEQKDLIEDLIEKEFGDQSKVSVKKDLAGKWRLVRMELTPIQSRQLDSDEKLLEKRHKDDEKIFTRVS